MNLSNESGWLCKTGCKSGAGFWCGFGCPRGPFWHPGGRPFWVDLVSISGSFLELKSQKNQTEQIAASNLNDEVLKSGIIADQEKKERVKNATTSKN